MQLDELKKLQTEVQESARNLEHNVHQEIQGIEHTASETAQSVAEALTPLSQEATSLLSTLPDVGEPLPVSIALEPATEAVARASSAAALAELKVAEAVSR
jgi:hypothetical protein